MAKTYYFYDLETSGIDAKWQRVMQFAGQRTDLDFNPIGDPHNILVKLPEDILPDPEAILVTGITPQKTIEEGITEKEFADFLMNEVFKANTIALGYNTIRFDDEFVRNVLYRNFYDPYEREWADGRKRWDILDLVRITRALRPDGINWPTKNGKNTVALESMTEANGISHQDAHDALSDVTATIEIAKLIRQKHPKLFEHVRSTNDKNVLKKYINFDELTPFVHCSGMLSGTYYSTSVFVPIAPHPTNSNGVILYDLRKSPSGLADKSIDQLREMLFSNRKKREAEKIPFLPVKLVHLNKSPVIAPLGVLDEKSQERIGLTIDQIELHRKELIAVLDDLKPKLVEIYQQGDDFPEQDDAEGRLYDGFVNDSDKKKMINFRKLDANSLSDFHPNFGDERLNQLILPYKARNFPSSLNQEEEKRWQQLVAKRLSDSSRGHSLKSYVTRLQKLADSVKTERDKFLLQELFFYSQNVEPFQQEELL